MTIQTRTAPYMPVTGISRYLTGDKSCVFAAWFKANHQGYKKMPSDFNSAKWNMEHTDLMNELVEELEERGCQIFIETPELFSRRERPLRCCGRRHAGHHRYPP